ncbi:MAG TPA: LiaF domain-containing protein [Flavisolibacter sp.]|nr:LiaF domain-containing protein [Flavisolibacter sp.]
MDERNFENKMEAQWGCHSKHREKSRVAGGLFLLLIGGLLLAKASGVYFPAWLFSWPVLIIGIGLLSGVRHGFRGIGWLFPIAIGGLFLADKMSADFNLRPYLWPILFIAAGIFIIFRPRGRFRNRDTSGNDTSSTNEIIITEPATTTSEKTQWQGTFNDRSDVIDITAVFGGVKKNVVTKSFRGGDIITFMGGTEVNLTQADFAGKITIDTFNMFGGTKLILPPDWNVQSEIVAIFGGVDDKRPPVPASAQNKVLYLEGTCIFGGLEIKSY